MKNSLWRVPAVAVGSSVLFSLVRWMVNTMVEHILPFLSSSSFVHTLLQIGLSAVGLLLIPLGGWLFCRQMTVRACALSATFVAAYILLYQIVYWFILQGMKVEIVPVTIFLAFIKLRIPVAVFSTSILNQLLGLVHLRGTFLREWLMFLSVGLPYIYVLFAGRERRQDVPEPFHL